MTRRMMMSLRLEAGELSSVWTLSPMLRLVTGGRRRVYRVLAQSEATGGRRGEAAGGGREVKSLATRHHRLSVTQADCCSDLESEPDDLISIFHEMSGGGGTWTWGKDVVLWSQLMTRFLLHSPRFLKKITQLLSSQNHFKTDYSGTTTFVAPCL